MQPIEDLCEIQQISLRLLKSFDAYCKENNFMYYLAWGTLLGAVRHKGFIPWDDDIDLMMPRADYDRLLAEAPDSLGDDVGFLIPKKGNRYVNSNVRLHDSRTFVDVSYAENPSGQGVWLTIFPLDKMPDDPALRRSYLKKTNLLSNLVFKSSISNAYRLGTLKKRPLHGLFLYALHFVSTIPVQRFYFGLQQKALRKYKDADTKEWTIQSIGTGAKIHFPASCFEETIPGEFEGGTYPIPSGWDEILHVTYGDYMKLPPEEKRVPKHDFTAYYK